MKILFYKVAKFFVFKLKNVQTNETANGLITAPASAFLRYSRTIGLVVLVSLGSGCSVTHQQTGIAYAEGEPFVAAPLHARAIAHEVRLRWTVREDAELVCRQQVSVGQRARLRPVACAIWDVDRKTCTIITPPSTTHLALGHELRHCFEGEFHP